MNYGIILVGTNINPLIISLNNMFDNNVEKIFLLATPKENYEKSTENFCDRTIEIFKNKDLKKILIDKSNINLIKKSIDNGVLKVIEEDKDLDKKIFLDFTGGTKIQSAFIKEYLGFKNKDNANYTELYVDGDSKKIITKIAGNVNCCYNPINELSMANDNNVIKIISNIKGYEYNKEENSIKDLKTNVKYKFDYIGIKDFKLYFRRKLKYKLGKYIEANKDYENKGKAKLELFQTIIDAEIIGEDFCKIEIIVPDNKDEYRKVLKNQLLGIRKEGLEKRITFKNEIEEEEK